MVLIKGQSNCAKVERLVSDINEEVIAWVEVLEDSGFKVSFINLGPTVDSQAYVNCLMDQISDLFNSEPSIH
jgi:hypothetical protein